MNCKLKIVKFASLQRAALKTLAYADIFDYPLTLEEVHRFLISPNLIDLKAIQNAISNFSGVEEKGGFFFLAGRENLVSIRGVREGASSAKMKKARRLASVIAFLPWVKFVGVTGSLAMRNSKEGDDIDLMIVTSPRRLWLCRLLVTMFLLLTGNYRRITKIKNRLCPNLYLTTDKLAVAEEERNLFTAHEVAQVVGLIDKEEVLAKFRFENRWVGEYLGNIKNKKLKIKNREGREGVARVFDFLDNVAFRFQRWWMRKKMTREKVDANLAAFHPKDAAGWVLPEFESRLKKLGISP